MCTFVKILDMLDLMFIFAHMVLKEIFGVINVYIYKNLDMLYLMFISAHMVLKEKFGVINVYSCKNIGHVVLNVYMCTDGFERNI
jgi:hypothetical protein